MADAEGTKSIATNRRARHDYAVLERVEAGVELRGTEVKSLRQGQASLAGSFCRVEAGQVYAQGFTIPPYEFGNRFNHPTDRPKRLLLHRKQIEKLTVQTEQKGFALIPLAVFFRRGLVKMDVGICRGKRQEDKRESLKRRDADREADRAMAQRRRG